MAKLKHYFYIEKEFIFINMKIDRILHFLFIVFIFLLGFQINAQQKPIKHEIVVKDITIPWGFTFLPDNSILYTEKKR